MRYKLEAVSSAATYDATGAAYVTGEGSSGSSRASAASSEELEGTPSAYMDYEAVAPFYSVWSVTTADYYYATSGTWLLYRVGMRRDKGAGVQDEC